MNTRRRYAMAAAMLGCCLAQVAWAQSERASGPDTPAPTATTSAYANQATRPASPKAPSWAELSDQQRTDLAGFADHWDTLRPERRLLLLERERRWQALPPKRRQALREGLRNFRALSPEQREKMRASFRAMRQLPPDQQQALRARWRAMTPEQRRDWLERGGPGIAPPPGS